MFNHIKKNIALLKEEVNQLEKKLGRSTPIDIVIATKYATLEETKAVLESGITHIGENKVQALVEKQSLMGSGVSLHMIGNLQSNKINKCLQYATFIDSVDSINLLEKLNKKGQDRNIQIKCLIQINIGNDPKKFGFSEEFVISNHTEIFRFQNIRIEGIMIVAPQADNVQTRQFYRKARVLFDTLKTNYPYLKTLSMGMSSDFKIAIEEGATQIRVGRRILVKEK